MLVAEPPAGLPEVFHGDPDKLAPWDGWFLWPKTNNPRENISISAILESPVYNDIFDDKPRFGTFLRVVSIRGHDAQLISYPSQSLSGGKGATKPVTRFEVSWAERGWHLSVGGEIEESVLGLAASLQDATDDQWAKNNKMERVPTPPTPDERRVANEASVSVATPGGDLKIRAGDLVTAEGCVNLVFEKVSGKDEKQCVKTTGSPVLWSGVREIGGKRVVLAVVDLHVDAVTLTTDTGAVSTQIVSSLTLDTVQPDGFVVDTAVTGGDYRCRWIGVVALAFDGDSPGQIEAFTNTEQDRDALPGLVEADTDTGSPAVDVERTSDISASGTDVDDAAPFDRPLKSLGRFPVG